MKKFLIVLTSVLMLASLLATSPVSAQAAHPTCQSADSDPDGDGYGWENGASCVAAETGGTDTAAETGSDTGIPTCGPGAVDNGDGWGWDNNASCRMPDNPAPTDAEAAAQAQREAELEAAAQAAAEAAAQALREAELEAAAQAAAEAAAQAHREAELEAAAQAAAEAAAAAAGDTVVCQLPDSDPDGDGYGWENGASCVVVETPPDPEVPTAPDNPDTGTPTCGPDAIDNGDGWGWDNNASCRMPDNPAPTDQPPTDQPPSGGAGEYEYVGLFVSALVINTTQRIWMQVPTECFNVFAGRLLSVDRFIDAADIEGFTQLESPGCDELLQLLESTAELEQMNVSDASVSADQVTFNWTPILIADGYIVSELPKTATSDVFQVAATRSFLSIQNLVPNTTYSFEFVATRNGARSEPTVMQATTSTVFGGERTGDVCPWDIPDPENDGVGWIEATGASCVMAHWIEGYDPLNDPTLNSIEIVDSSTEGAVTLDWTDWAASLGNPPDGYIVTYEPTSVFGTRYLDADETTYIDNGISLPGGGTLGPGQDRAYGVQAYRERPDRSFFGPRIIVESATAAAGSTSVQGLHAFTTIDAATRSVGVPVFWQAPSQFTPLDGFVISNGLYEVDLPIGELEIVNDSFVYRYPEINPSTASQAELVWYDDIINRRVVISVRAYAQIGGERRFGASDSVRPIAFTDDPIFVTPEGEPGRPLEALVDRLLPNLSGERRSTILNQIWNVHNRELLGLDGNHQQITYLVDLLIEEGVAIDLRDLQDPSISGPIPSYGNAPLLRQLVDLAPAQRLDEVVRGFGPSGSGEMEAIRLRLRDFGDEGRADRSQQYGQNLDIFQDAIDRLQDDGGLDELREVKALADIQAGILLNTEQTRGGELRYAYTTIAGIIPAGGDDFATLWLNANRDERIAYWGFDGFGYELAAPYLDLAHQADRNIDRMTSRTRQFITLAITIVATIVLAQVGVAGAEFVGLTGAGATIVGGAIGTYATVIFLGGSTSDAEKAAWQKLLTGGLDYLIGTIPIDNRSFGQTAILVLLEAGRDVITEGANFNQALLEAIGRHYVPGLSDFLADDNIAAQIAGEFGTVLILSYIENGPDWDLIFDDLETYGLELFGNWIGAEIADLLPDGVGWEAIGNDLAAIISIAISTGNEDGEVEAAIISAVGRRAANLVGQSVGNIFGNEDGWQAELASDLTTMYFDVLATTPSDQVASEFDRRLGQYLLERAGEWSGDQLRSLLTQFNGGQSAGWIDFTAGLVTVAISNGNLDSAELQLVLEQYVATFLATFITGLTPGCLPPWVDESITTIVRTIGNGGSTDQVLNNLQTLVESTSAAGGFDDLGSCGSPTTPSDTLTCTHSVPIPATAAVGTQVCAEDGRLIYRHSVGLWAVVGSNEIRLQDNDGVNGDGIVEVPASVIGLHPIVVLLGALGTLVILTMQSETSDDLVITSDFGVSRHSDFGDAWNEFPDAFFQNMSQDDIQRLFTVRSGDDEFEEFYEITARVRMAVIDNRTAVLQYRELFGDWFTTDREFSLSRGGQSAQAIVSFDAIDSSPAGLENRTAGLPLPLSTTSDRARTAVNAENRDGEWQAHHLIPVHIILRYQEMFIEAVNFGLSDDASVLSQAGFLTDAANNLILLPENTDTQREFFLETQICLPVHRGHSHKHMAWDRAAEVGFTGPVGNTVDGVALLNTEWELTPIPAPESYWLRWNNAVLNLQFNLRERIKDDTVGEIGCGR